MPAYVCKRYQRSAAGAATGTLTDELRFTAASAQEAETRMRRGMLSPPPIGPMDWERYFATLEDESGTVLVTWLHGALHA
jgi:hypothetical protein